MCIWKSETKTRTERANENIENESNCDVNDSTVRLYSIVVVVVLVFFFIVRRCAYSNSEYMQSTRTEHKITFDAHFFFHSENREVLDLYTYCL